MNDQRFEVAESARRMAQMIQIGTIDSVDYTAARARVKIGALITAPLPMLTTRAGADRVWDAYTVGEQVAVFAPVGDLAQGLIMGAIYSAANAANGDRATLHRRSYADGTVVEYDQDAGALAVQLAGGAVTLTAPGGVNITGTVTVAGDVVADGISLKTHVHGGVVAGPADTGGPK